MNTATKRETARPVAAAMVKEIVALVTLSAMLGLAFNASNPVGIRFGESIASKKPSLRTTAPPARMSHSTNGVYQNELLSLVLKEGSYQTMPGTTSTQTISWEETKALMSSKNAVLVDTRTAAAYAAGHIPGAVSLSVLSSASDLAEFLRLHDPRTPLIVYCASASCPIAEHMAKKLSDIGFQSVHVFAGGYLEWQRTESKETASAHHNARSQP